MDAIGELAPAGMSGGLLKWQDGATRGDRIKWLTSADPSSLSPEVAAFIQRMRLIGKELAARAPELGLTGRVSIQLACYPGKGERYVRHLDCRPGRAAAAAAATRSVADTADGTGAAGRGNGGGDGGDDGDDGLEGRQLTALYYLNGDWQHRDGGCLRAFLRRDVAGSMAQAQGSHQLDADGNSKCDGDDETSWDVEPILDRLLVFRSPTVEHEVLPSFAPRLALTVWYYGRPARASELAAARALSASAKRSVMPVTPAPSGVPGTSASATAGNQEGESKVASSVHSAAKASFWTMARPSPEEHAAWMAASPPRSPLPCFQSSKSSATGAGHNINQEGPGRIFVSIASYRDSECQHTVRLANMK